MEKKLVKNIMTDDVVVISSDATIFDAAELMNDFDIGFLPVLDGERLIGVITDRDIVIRALANGLDIDTPVVDIMTTEIISTSPESTLKEASRKMMINQVKRLPVLDENNLVGVISLRDIVINDCDIEITKVLDGIYQDTDTAGNIDFNSADVDDFRL